MHCGVQCVVLGIGEAQGEAAHGELQGEAHG